MSELHFESRDLKRDNVRAACAALEQELLRLPANEAQELRKRWTELVAALALEPARALRECPTCGNAAMLEATRCFHCWAKLPVSA